MEIANKPIAQLLYEVLEDLTPEQISELKGE
jgi:hypothetical protein